MQSETKRSGPVDWHPEDQERYIGAEKNVLEWAVSIPPCGTHRHETTDKISQLCSTDLGKVYI